jgi:hypothetical protein
VVVKTRLQSNEDSLPERERAMVLIVSEFVVDRELSGYGVYGLSAALNAHYHG